MENLFRWSKSPIFLIALWLIALAGMFVLTGPFSSNSLIRAGLAASTAPLAVRSTRRVLDNMREKRDYQQYYYFLQSLSGDLSAGHSLTRALLNSADNAPNQFGEHSSLGKALQNAANHLRAQYSLRDVLTMLSQQISVTEAGVLFRTLAGADMLGNRIVFIIRDAKERTATLHDLEEEVRAEQHGQIMQGMILIAMPFVLAFLFRGLFASFSSQSVSLISSILMVVAFIIAALSALVISALLFSTQKDENKPNKSSGLLRVIDRLTLTMPIQKMSELIFSHLPAFYRNRQKHLIDFSFLPSQFQIEPDGIDNRQIEIRFTGRKVVLMICLFISSLLLCIGRKLPWFALPLGAPIGWLLIDINLRESVKEYKKQLIEDTPLFLDIILQQLKMGVTLSNALTDSLRTLTTANRSLTIEISRLSRAQSMGMGRAALKKLAGRCQVTAVRTVFFLLEQYDKTGHQDLLNSLRRQKEISWNLYKDTYMRRVRELSGKLTLPMMMDLLSVVLIALSPAVSVFIGV